MNNEIFLIDEEAIELKNISDAIDSTFLIAPFNTRSDSPIWSFDAKSKKILTIQELSDISIKCDKDITNENIYTTSKDSYLNSITNMILSIKKGEINKGVLSRVKRIKSGDLQIIKLFIKLLMAYPSAFIYLSRLPNGELWCGASPELLAKYKNNDLQTMALAGTQLLAGKDTQELVWTEKEREEQKWVQEHISGIFTTLKLKYSRSDTYTRKAAHLAHLCTDFSCKTDSKTAQNILKLLHPTPAICGTPTQEAKRVILELEKHDRKYYTGYIGLYSSQEFQLFVNLRCMMIDKDHYHLFVGGGITEDSIAENEWVETENKARVLENVL